MKNFKKFIAVLTAAGLVCAAGAVYAATAKHLQILHRLFLEKALPM